MKKKLSIITLLIVLLIGLTSCSTKEKSEYEDLKSSLANANISLTLKEGTLSNTKGTFILKNSSDTSLSYGNPYWIEREDEEGNWVRVKTISELDFTMEAYELKPGKSKTFDVDWEVGYGELPEGKYRLVKNITIENKSDSRDTFYIAAEFIIE